MPKDENNTQPPSAWEILANVVRKRLEDGAAKAADDIARAMPKGFSVRLRTESLRGPRSDDKDQTAVSG